MKLKGLMATIVLGCSVVALASCGDEKVTLTDENGKNYTVSKTKDADEVLKVVTSLSKAEGKVIDAIGADVDLDLKESETVDNVKTVNDMSLDVEVKIDTNGKTIDKIDEKNSTTRTLAKNNLKNLGLYASVDYSNKVTTGEVTTNESVEVAITKTDTTIDDSLYVIFGDISMNANGEKIPFDGKDKYATLLANKKYYASMTDIYSYTDLIGYNNLPIIINNILASKDDIVSKMTIADLSSEDTAEIKQGIVDYKIQITGAKNDEIKFSAEVPSVLASMYDIEIAGSETVALEFGISTVYKTPTYVKVNESGVDATKDGHALKIDKFVLDLEISYNDDVKIKKPSGKFEPLANLIALLA